MAENREIEKKLKELRSMTGLPLVLDWEGQRSEEEALSRLERLCGILKNSRDKETVMQKWILGETTAHDFYPAAEKLRIRKDAERVLLYLQLQTEKETAGTAEKLIRQLLADRTGLMVMPCGERELLILLPVMKKDEGDFGAVAESILGALNAELYTDGYIAAGEPCRDLAGLPEAYRVVVRCFEAGRLFYPDRRIFTPADTWEAVLLCGPDEETCRRYLRIVLDGEGPGHKGRECCGNDAFTGDLLLTAECFLENDLNIAETSRRLHLHRNTFLYRLEQIRNDTGLDIRRFPDAMRYRLCALLRRRLKDNGS